MSLDRKDLRAKLCPAKHAQLSVIAECDGKDIGEIVEEVMCEWINRRVSDATVLADRLSRLGTSGNRRETPGVAGSGRESAPSGCESTPTRATLRGGA